MVDLSDKGSESEEMSRHTPERVSTDSSNLKTCVNCGKSKTPLWRGGPAGPKSLCNACGIRSRKKIRALMGVAKEEKKTKRSTSGKSSNHQTSSSNSSTGSSGRDNNNSGKNSNRLWDFEMDVSWQRPRSNTRRKLREEEQAAFLLMALSCGSVYA